MKYFDNYAVHRKKSVYLSNMLINSSHVRFWHLDISEIRLLSVLNSLRKNKNICLVFWNSRHEINKNIEDCITPDFYERWLTRRKQNANRNCSDLRVVLRNARESRTKSFVIKLFSWLQKIGNSILRTWLCHFLKPFVFFLFSCRKGLQNCDKNFR